MFWAGSATAQVSGQAGVASDLVYRGLSLSGGKPGAQLSLAYDHTSGGYGGVALSQADRAIWLAYLGLARRIGQDWSLDAGITQRYASLRPGRYREFYAGVATSRVLARLSYSPDYASTGTRTWYGELAASAPLTDSISLVARAGYLAGAFHDPVRRRSDASAGLLYATDQVKIELTANAVRAGHNAAPAYVVPLRKAKGVVLSVARPF
ncbi:MAG: TorF family putative porin [Gammaproteobacteria bacterium]